MIGVIIASHGTMAEGIKNALTMFFGDDIERLETLCLHPEDSSDKFLNEIKESCIRIDEGDGVVIFTDLYGGTPCNLAICLNNSNLKIISGMNLGLLMEFLAIRPNVKLLEDLNWESILDIAKSGIKLINEIEIGKEEETDL